MKRFSDAREYQYRDAIALLRKLLKTAPPDAVARLTTAQDALHNAWLVDDMMEDAPEDEDLTR